MSGTVTNVVCPSVPRYSTQLTSILILVTQSRRPSEVSNLPNVSWIGSGRARNPNQCWSPLLHSSPLSPTTPPLESAARLDGRLQAVSKSLPPGNWRDNSTCQRKGEATLTGQASFLCSCSRGTICHRLQRAGKDRAFIRAHPSTHTPGEILG